MQYYPQDPALNHPASMELDIEPIKYIWLLPPRHIGTREDIYGTNTSKLMNIAGLQ